MKIGLRLVKRPPAVEKIIKNLNYGTAVGLTKTAKEGQAAVVASLGSTFTLRGNWWQQSNKFGIKIKPATREDLQAEVRTQADWLEIHEQGGTKTARGGRLAIPTENVRRNKRQIIARANRPSALRGKRTFIIKTSKGDVLYQRKYYGKRSVIVPLYNLEPRARIKKQSTFFDPIERIVKKNLHRNIEMEVRKALATMR